MKISMATPKLFDCFLFWKELNALEIRLNELYEVVDKFIIVEFSKSHTGLSKPFYLKDNLERFSQFSDKMSVYSLNYELHDSNPLKIAHDQRRILDEIIFSLKPRPIDLILTSDSDEIIKASILKNIKLSGDENCNVIFELNMFHNYLNNFISTWLRPRLIVYKRFKGFSFSYRDIFIKTNAEFRRFKFIPIMRINSFFSATKLDVKIGTWIGSSKNELKIIKNAGWHFTKLYPIEDHYEHAKNTPHTESLTKDLNLNSIKLRVHNNQTSYGPVLNGTIISMDSSFPIYILENINRFSSYIVSPGVK
jgi:beta-1,4-mannosyl-glycoprotein beta-1,4-N-acetylglucosaminyltransferase